MDKDTLYAHILKDEFTFSPIQRSWLADMCTAYANHRSLRLYGCAGRGRVDVLARFAAAVLDTDAAARLCYIGLTGRQCDAWLATVSTLRTHVPRGKLQVISAHYLTIFDYLGSKRFTIILLQDGVYIADSVWKTIMEEAPVVIDLNALDMDKAKDEGDFPVD